MIFSYKGPDTLGWKIFASQPVRLLQNVTDFVNKMREEGSDGTEL